MKVTSIFFSVNGEVNCSGQGSWSTFIRFTGCSARCNYCDTQYSWKKGKEMSVDKIIEGVNTVNRGSNLVTITGGEPLEQPLDELLLLFHQLRIKGYHISVETNGLHNPSRLQQYSPYVSLIMDVKLPSAGEHVWKKVNIDNYKYLTKDDFVKFVISTTQDFRKALMLAKKIKEMNRGKVNIFFSPNMASMPALTLFELMKKVPNIGKLNIGYNLQIHKFIFGKDFRQEEK